MGPPCQPYSDLRANMRSTPPEDHPKYYTIFDTGDDTDAGGVIQHLAKFRPDSFFLEEVAGFNRENPQMPLSGTYLARFTKAVKGIVDASGNSLYVVRCVKLLASTWVTVLERERFPHSHAHRASHSGGSHCPCIHARSLFRVSLVHLQAPINSVRFVFLTDGHCHPERAGHAAGALCSNTFVLQSHRACFRVGG